MNKEYRNKLRNNPHSVFHYIDKDLDIVVKTNTKTTIYMVLPVLNTLETQELEQLQAAGTTSSAATLGSVATAGSLSCPSTIGSLSSVGTVGSASSIE